MSKRKIVLPNGESRYEVRLYKDGRGSKYVNRRFKTAKDADRFREEQAQKLREVRSHGSISVRGFEETTFGQEAEYWLTRRNHRFSPGHLKRVNGILTEILPNYGTLNPDRFTFDLIEDLQAEQLESGKKPATVNRKTEVIAAILNFSAKNRRIPFNPCAQYEKLRVVREGVAFWERDEAQAFLSFADKKYPFGSEHQWVYVVYLDALNTAKRAGEIWALRPSDLKQGGEVQYVHRQFDRVKKDFGPLKWHMPPRNVPCNAELRKELTSLVAQHKIPQDRTFFSRPDGSPICHETFVRSFYDKDIAEAGIRRIRFHDLRHTASTFFVDAGYDPKTVMEICGHKDLKTTMLYVHLLGDKIKEVARNHSVLAPARSEEKVGRVLRLVR